MQKQHKGRFVPVMCNILGVLLILLVFAATIPLVVPSFIGYESFSVESGSMEPDFPVGSVVYVKECEPQEVRTGDVITFVKEETVITHRVVENHVVEGEYITKGDANPQEDIESVPYTALIGRVEYHLPYLGAVLTVIASSIGKVYILLVGAIGVMLNILAGRIRATRRRRALEAAREAAQEDEKRKAIEEQKRQIRAKYGLPEVPEVSAEVAAEAGSDSEGTVTGQGAGTAADESAVAAAAGAAGTTAGGSGGAPRKKKHTVRKVLMVILALIFVGAGVGALMVKLQYKHSDDVYANAAHTYTAQSVAAAATSTADKEDSDLIPSYLKKTASVGSDANGADQESAGQAGTDGADGSAVDSTNGSGQTGNDTASDGTLIDENESEQSSLIVLLEDEDLYEEESGKTPADPAVQAQYVKDLDIALIEAEKKELRGMRILAPIRVDFDSLLDVTEDVKGWIYCKDTNINYPVLHGETNDTYLRHTYDGEYNIAGSIFIETDNDPEFQDLNTIVYGHHMNDGSMFANLEDWADQDYYEEHPVMWILTPEQDYMMVLVAGYHTSAYSDAYTIFYEPDEEFRAYLDKAVEQSDFKTNLLLPLGKNTHYVMLTTCAYIFDNARYVIHGLLIPADSAGGKPLW